MVACLKKLDYINKCILKKENPNRDMAAIREAAYEKKKFIINQLLFQLPKHKKFFFLARLGQWRENGWAD